MTNAEILKKISNLKVLIIGDLCLDRWCRYNPALSEPSRETGLPRTAVVSTEVTPGAAGTIANNLRALGVPVSIVTAVGDDGFGFELERALKQRRIGVAFVYRAPGLSTFTYTKLINDTNGIEDLPRVDFIQANDIPKPVEDEIYERVHTAWDGFDVIIVSDQAETETGGIITKRIRDLICSRAATSPKNKIVWVDSRVRSEYFRNVIVKPNRDEAIAASKRALGRVDFPAFRQLLNAPQLIVTMGGEGALVVEESGELMVPGFRIENPVDICGAGDSFTAGAACALAVSGSPETAVRFGNTIASITIMKHGTGTASPEEVLAKQ
jgi:rfaE bifunctional protein kinase chain/domain